jgi:hypothetical protein
MFYSIWLFVAALAGWAGGKIAGDDGFETGADSPPLNYEHFHGSVVS